MAAWGRQLAFALRFFTRFPVLFRIKLTPGDIAESGKWFPLIGFFEGVFVAFIVYVFALFRNDPYVLALACLVARTIVSNAQIANMGHATDGLYSSRDRIESVRIMLDENYGARGIAMMCIDCLMRFVLYAQLFYSLGAQYALPVLILSCVGGKTAVSVGIATSTSVFNRDRLIDDSRMSVAVIAVLITSALAFILIGWQTMLLMVILEISLGLIISGTVMLKLGGLTKQVLSMICEFGEIAFLYTVLIW